jgi:hypothetical protein
MASDRFHPVFPDDRENPYAPPQADVGPEKAPLGSVRVPPEIGAVVARAWEAYKQRMGSCIAAVLIWFVFYALGQVLVAVMQTRLDQQGIQPGGPPLPPDLSALGLYLITVFGVMIFQLWIDNGMYLFLLRIAQGQDAPLGLIFAGGPYLLPVIGASILNFLIVCGTFLTGLIPGSVAVLLSSWSPAGRFLMRVCVVVAAIAALVVWLRLSQFKYLIVDREAGVVNSLRMSFEITKGYTGTVLVVWIFAAMIGLSGILGCGVGILFTAPIGWLMIIVLYLALIEQSAQGGKDEPVAELELI